MAEAAAIFFGRLLLALLDLPAVNHDVVLVGDAVYVVDLMRKWRSDHTDLPDVSHVIGPITMMRAAAALTREWGVPTLASLNPIMIDGSGMCGGCRATVGGKIRFACVEGPEFDAHEVDLDELARRSRAYLEQERLALAEYLSHRGPWGSLPGVRVSDEAIPAHRAGSL